MTGTRGGMDEVKSRLADLASRISAGRIGSSEFWVGADVAILDSEPEARQPRFYPVPRWVVTPNAAELSWLFHELRNAFIDHYDGQSKVERSAAWPMRLVAISQGWEKAETLKGCSGPFSMKPKRSRTRWREAHSIPSPSLSGTRSSTTTHRANRRRQRFTAARDY